jgi:aminoglycoside 6'-N-acetyltransferase
MTFSFRPLATTDFAQFAAWLAQPHVQKWWREPATVEHVAEEYGACTRGDCTTRVFVVSVDGHDIGIMQCYMLASYPEYDELFGMPDAASIDYLIGVAEYVGRGVGTAMIGEFIEQVVWPAYPEATRVVTSVEVENGASLGALKKAGFKERQIITGEYGTPERVMVRELGAA